jgi:hypothetical protein
MFRLARACANREVRAKGREVLQQGVPPLGLREGTQTAPAVLAAIRSEGRFRLTAA